MESSSLPFPSTPRTLHQEAALLRLARVMGLVDHAAVVAWADATLLASEPVPDGLVALALTGEARWKDALGLLRRFAEGADEDLAGRQALGLLRRRVRAGTMSTADAVRALHAYLASERGRLTADQVGAITVLDDYAHLWPSSLEEALDRYLTDNSVEGADLGPSAT